MGRQVWVTTTVRGPVDDLWHLTQDTALHPRWDLRSSAITPAGTDDDGRRRFTYALALPHPRLPLLTVRGTGTSTAERRRDDGGGTSALSFTAGPATAQHLAVDLEVGVDDDGALRITSAGQRSYEGPLGFRFPMLASGTAVLR